MAPALLLGVLAAAAAGTPPPREWIEFVGFSKDGRLAAYRRDVDVTLPDGGHDQYTLMQTVDVRSGYDIAAFQTSIHRITGEGRPVAIKRSELAKIYPRYDQAFASKRWLELEKRERFSQVAIHGSPELIQLGVDEDVEVEAGEAPEGLMLAVAAGGALGFQVVAHGKDGKAVDGGVFRKEGQEGQSIAARIQVFTTKAHKGVAVLVSFLLTRGPEVTTAPMLKVVNAELANLAATAAAAPPTAEGGRRAIDPWHMKFSPNDEPPKMKAADKAKVPASERRAIEQTYRDFVGEPLPMSPSE